jgi:16S rRNA (cytosine967-C5)-methyltransferase
VFETVELASARRRSLINGMMRNAVRERDRLKIEAAKAPLHIRESHPEFLVRRWLQAFGENSAAAICRWNNSAAPIYARINTLRISREDFLERNPTARPITAHPLFVECEGLPEAAIGRGDCYIQDPSTAVAVDLLEPQSGEMILDACAAPGGKTSHMAAITKNTANIVACDRDAARLGLLRENLSHLSAVNTQVIQHDWLHDRYPEILGLKEFDKILVDVPCTNTGVMRRRIDVRWRLRPADFESMPEQQFRIVRAVLPLLRPGGVLVYSTCSIEREENEELIERLVHEVPTLRLEQTRTILPWRDHLDGAFAARFVLTA